MHCKSLWIKASAKCINVNVDVCVPCIFILYIQKHTHTCLYVRQICYVYILNIFIYNINYMNVNVFKIYTLCACLYIYIMNIQYTHIYYINKTFDPLYSVALSTMYLHLN